MTDLTNHRWSSRRETFVYEYIGEVISETTFRKRIKDYAEEGIQHFYFMMLQKEEVRSTIRSGLESRPERLLK